MNNNSLIGGGFWWWVFALKCIEMHIFALVCIVKQFTKSPDFSFKTAN